MRNWLWACGGLALIAALAGQANGQTLSEKVKEAQKKRIAAIKKAQPSVVAVMARDVRGNLTGNGSGVLIDEDGYALTNWHVTNAARSPLLKCGLPDGKTYDAVLVGLDKVGDVALIKLYPKKEGEKFPFAKMADSDKVRAGDWSLAMGNPFSLATDFTPTVTYGMVSGVHRYQYPAGTLLEYTDCIQVDTSINPGNSGGPLFNMDGDLIGINGRISLEKRGRVNVGVGYAISINQIKNFMGHLRVGLDSDHASLGASMESESEDVGLSSKILVKAMIESDAMRRGLEPGDQLFTFAGRYITSVNQYKNVLGLFPKGWRVPMSYKRTDEGKSSTTRHDVLVRLMGVQRRELLEGGGPQPPPKQPKGPQPQPPQMGGPMAKYYKAKEGFANYYFNEVARDAVMARLVKESDLTKKDGDWKITFTGTRYTNNGKKPIVKSWIEILDKGASDKKSPKVKSMIDDVDDDVEPLSTNEKAEKLKGPAETGGLLVAMYNYRQFLVNGIKVFRDLEHGGWEPFYPATTEEKPDWLKTRVMCEVLNARHAGVAGKWYFALEDDTQKEKRWSKGQLIGFEITVDKDEDPCEVCLSHYKTFGANKLPSRIHVRYKGKKYADFDVTEADLK